MQRKIRVLVGKPGLDGHDRGAKVVAAALRDAGMEVVYTGLHQAPEQIIEAAIQEDVDVVALSILSGAHMTLFPEILELMTGRGIGDKLLTGGGIIPAEDMETLAGMGVGRLFGPGASTQDIARYIREWFIGIHGEDSLAPMPPPPTATHPSTTSFVQGELWSPSPATSAPSRTSPTQSPKPATKSSRSKAAAKQRAGGTKPAAKRARPGKKSSAPRSAPARKGAAKRAPARATAKRKAAPRKTAKRKAAPPASSRSSGAKRASSRRSVARRSARR
jgi:methylmalonyl-CoA mutase C-terminal domain/subunit